jgi:iron complex outermembrane receptor protein
VSGSAHQSGAARNPETPIALKCGLPTSRVVSLRKFPPWCPIVATLLAAPAGLAAEDRPVRLAPVVVDATRLPAETATTPWPVTVVAGDAVNRARQGLGLDEALVSVPGVYAQNRYNFAQDLRLSIRGFGARSTFGIRGLKLLVDGVPATLPDGQAGVDAVDLAELERIEVIRGPAAALHGAAAGGVVSLVSRAPPSTPHADASLGLGGHGFAEQRLRAGGGSDAGAGIVTLAHSRIDGFRRQSAAERTLLGVRGHAALPGGRTLRLSLSAVDSPLAEDPGALTAAERAADRRQAAPLNRRFRTGETVEQERLGTQLTLPAATGELRARAYGVRRAFDSRLPFQTVSLDRLGGGGALEWHAGGRGTGTATRWLAGIALDHMRDRRRRRVSDDGVPAAPIADQRERVSALAAFLLADLDLGERVRVSAGIRGDRVRFRVDDAFLADGDQSGDDTFSALSPQLGAVFTLSDSVDLYTNASTAFETPTTTELASPGGAGGFNTALDAQRAWSLEAGLRAWPAGDALALELAVFHIRVEDELVPFPIPGAPGRFAFQNAGRSRHLGVEAAMHARVGETLELRAAWTWSRFDFRSYTDRAGARLDGRRLPGIPRNLLGLDATWRPGRGGYLAADAQAASRRFADSANTAASPGYLVLNARGGYEWRHGAVTLAVHAGLNNVLAARYDSNLRINASGGRFFEPAPGRTWYAGAGATLEF